MLVLCRFTSPLQSGASRAGQLWLALAALLVIGWIIHRWPAATLPVASEVRQAPRSTAPSMHRSSQSLRHTTPMHADLGSLITAARETTAVGSHYRALRALDFCARQARHMLDDRNHDALDTSVFADPRQALALMRIRSLCARDAGTATLDYYALAEEGLERPDPVLSLALRLERLSAAPHESADLQDAATRRDLITRIFATDEPALFGDLANELALLAPRLSFTVAGVEVEQDAHEALIAALRDLACGNAGCFDSREQLLRCAAAAQCDPATDGAPMSWQRTRFLALLQFSGGRVLDFSYRPVA
ncbi:MAG: hypothetical protein JNM76_15940 [Betaproteobacteria bacterium]|nr:hypothetical protein [Betaproteobacteria bacterium]